MHRWETLTDLAILAVAVYVFLRWTAENRLRVMLLATSGLFGLSALASRMDLPLTAWVFEAFGLMAVLFLVTIFQSELRHLVMRTEGVVSEARPGVQSGCGASGGGGGGVCAGWPEDRGSAGGGAAALREGTGGRRGRTRRGSVVSPFAGDLPEEFPHS
ncbi:MAG: hypothetical protein QM757_42020 [Paludibaculum sp.]